MASNIRFLMPRTSPKTLYQSLQPRFQFLRNLHSFLSQESNSRNFHKCHPTNSRGIVSAPNYNLDEASAASLTTLDKRIPATVITGFLGSGKVPFLIHSQKTEGFFFFLMRTLLVLQNADNSTESYTHIPTRQADCRHRKRGTELKAFCCVIWYRNNV
jgi:hypothetical protein